MSIPRIVPTVLAAGAVALVAACARQGAPPGGPPDRRPPVVAVTVPDTFAVDSTFRGPVRFDFNERISERVSTGTLDGAVVVSPRTGQVSVSHSRAGIEVDMAGGFKPGLVYRVTLLPVFKDMFNNQMRDPFDLVFSTGAPFVPSALAGMVWDRITGEPVKDMDVMATAMSDSTRYFAMSDTAGIYVFRYVPPGRYRLTAFEDRNQNHRLDRTEANGERSVLLNGPDTLLPLDIATLQPDTSHARIRLAEALDSLTVVVSFDHFIDPDEPTSLMSATLGHDSIPGPGVVGIFQEYRYNQWVDQIRDSVARLDSIAAAASAAAAAAAAPPDTMPPADTTAHPAAGDTTVARDTTVADTAPAPKPPERYLPPRLQGGPGGGGPPPGRGPKPSRPEGIGPDDKPLPKQRIVLRLDSALTPNVDYVVVVQGITTVNGVPQGGGQAHFTRQPPKDTTTTPKDTTAANDTSAVKDTTTVPDTSRQAGRRVGGGRPSAVPYSVLEALLGRHGGR